MAGADPRVSIDQDKVQVGRWFGVSFERTLRIPDDGQTYPLPPSLGRFPVRRVDELAERSPARWRAPGELLIPMYQREALWLAFDGEPWHPCAVQVGVGGLNALTGEPWGVELTLEPQNYLVCPDQPWLDGIKAGPDVIRQFVAMPLGLGYTVEGQLTGVEEEGGIQLRVYEPKPDRFPDRPPPSTRDDLMLMRLAAPAGAGAMGLGVGGAMRQKLYPDPHGLDTWDLGSAISLTIQIVNSEQYAALTGQPPPPSPIDASIYTEHGFPWYDLYDEERGDLEAARRLAELKSIRELDAEQGDTARRPEDASVAVDPAQIRKLRPPGQAGSAN